MSKSDSSRLETGREAMHAEALAIETAAKRLDGSFEQAVEIILKGQTKLVICGIGKSGHIGCKLAATFSSCGVPSVFLHAAEAIHGDLGVYQPGDPTIVLSKSGSTGEVLRLMPMLKKFESPVIAIVGNTESPIAQAADVVIDASVQSEADPLNLMPTSSSTVTLALGDALAAATVKARDFTPEEFAKYHPGGQLGRNLLLTVGEVMHPVERVATTLEHQTLREVVICMTQFPLGAACVVDDAGKLKGIITDGDVRRLLSDGGEILKRSVGDCMTRSPIFTQAEVSLGDALRIMEDRSSQISVLPVVGEDSETLLGLLRLHDAYQPGLS
ncbi:MAG: KpsF/GutQ family sugar-phosphate isomerase [Coraliomargarita sp.]|nr:KpsF/GutQ family sugar-phosphate isomerase [Coraliomargarita sp.]